MNKDRRKQLGKIQDYPVQLSLRNTNFSVEDRARAAVKLLHEQIEFEDDSRGSADRLSHAWTWLRSGLFVVGPLPGRKIA